MPFIAILIILLNMFYNIESLNENPMSITELAIVWNVVFESRRTDRYPQTINSRLRVSDDTTQTADILCTHSDSAPLWSGLHICSAV